MAKKELKDTSTELQNIALLGNKVLLDPLPIEDKTTKSGIVLPSHLQKNSQAQGKQWGKIVKVGLEVEENYPNVKVGDKVLLTMMKAFAIEFDDKEYVLIEASDVMVKESR